MGKPSSATTEDLIKQLTQLYKNMETDPPMHNQLVIVIQPSFRTTDGYIRFFGTYDSFNQTIQTSHSHHGPKAVTKHTYWLPAPGIPSALIKEQNDPVINAKTSLEYYDAITAKQKNFPTIGEIYRCEMFLKRGCLSLYGPGLNPPTKATNQTKDRIAAYFQREDISKPSKDDVFRYFLQHYSQELITEGIFTYEQLVYRTTNLR